MELTPKQQEVFDYLVEYRRQRGYFPTRKEIGNHIGKGAGSAQFHLHRIEEKGYIELMPGMQRGIKVLSQKSDMEDFEQWSESVGYCLDKHSQGAFVHRSTTHAWIGWQAARSNM